MIDIFLGFVILILALLNGYQLYLGRQDKEFYTKALLSKNTEQFKELIEDKKEEPKYVPQPEFVAEAAMDDEEWFKKIVGGESNVKK